MSHGRSGGGVGPRAQRGAPVLLAVVSLAVAHASGEVDLARRPSLRAVQYAENASTRAERLTALWALGADGNWQDPIAWSTEVVPNDTIDAHFDVVIDTGYAVAHIGDTTISTLRLNATDATLSLLGGSFRAVESAMIQSGRIVQQDGDARFGALGLTSAASVYELHGGRLIDAPIENHGSILIDGGVLDTTDLVNAGLIRMTSGELHLRGNYTTAELAGVEAPGGVLSLYGDWDNAGATRDFTAQTGGWRLERVDLSGGSMRYLDGLHAVGELLSLRDIAIEAASFDFRRFDVFENVQVSGGDIRAEEATIWRSWNYSGGDVVLEDRGKLVFWIFEPEYAIDGYGVRSEAAASDPASLVFFSSLHIAAGSKVIGAINIGGERDGAVQGLQSLRNDGLIRLEAPGGSLAITDTTLSGAGDLEIGQDTAVTFVRSTLALVDGAWGGDLRFGAGASIASGAATPAIALTRNANQLHIDGPAPGVLLALASIRRNDGQIFLNNGAAQIFAAPQFVNDGQLTIDAASMATIAGSFVSAVDSALRFGLAANSVLRADAPLHITDQIALDGALEVTLEDPLSLAIGDRIHLISAGAVTGEFSSLLLPGIAGGGEFAVEYSATTVDLVVVVPAPGGAGAALGVAVLAARRRRHGRLAD